MSLHFPKNNGPGMFKGIFRHWNLLFRVVCCNGWLPDGHAVGPPFSSFNAMLANIAKKLLSLITNYNAPWRMLFDIFFITLQEDFVYGFKVLVKKWLQHKMNWPKTAISSCWAPASWYSPRMLQNVKINRIHCNTLWGGLIIWCFLFSEVDLDGPITREVLNKFLP